LYRDDDILVHVSGQYLLTLSCFIC
jgi:hypothetical protein